MPFKKKTPETTPEVKEETKVDKTPEVTPEEESPASLPEVEEAAKLDAADLKQVLVEYGIEKTKDLSNRTKFMTEMEVSHLAALVSLYEAVK